MFKKYHFISIGGSIMHNLAIALSEAGHNVTGSDDEIYEPAFSALKKHGLLPDKTGWFPDRIHGGLDAVILGMHAKKDNPELLKALELKLPLFSFPEFMYEISKEKPRIVVAGSHGKTTVTSMLLHIFKEAGRKCNFLVGARLKGYKAMVNTDPGAELALFEGDEYLASALQPVPKFLFYRPDIAIITGIAWDHINVFPSFELYLEQFRKLIHGIPPEGTLIYNESDRTLAKLVEQSDASCKCIPYRTPACKAGPGGIHFHLNGEKCRLPMLGIHNAGNYTAAALAAKAYGLDYGLTARAASGFSGPSRRLEIISRNDELTLIDDFAHAPSKVRASVAAVRLHYPHHHFIAVLELHTFSSLRPEFLKEYEGSLSEADEALVYLNPEALKKKGAGIDEEMIYRSFGCPGLTVSQDISEIQEAVKNKINKNSVILLMSSGHWGGKDWSDLATFAAARKKGTL